MALPPLKYGQNWSKCQRCHKLFVVSNRVMGKQRNYCPVCRMLNNFI